MCHISPDQWVAPLDDVILVRSLTHLGLLLRHLPGCLDLPDLGRAGDRLPVWAQRPAGGAILAGGR